MTNILIPFFELRFKKESVVIVENFISKFGLTGICLFIMAIWAFGASKKFKAAVDENPFGDYEQPQTASKKILPLPI